MYGFAFAIFQEKRTGILRKVGSKPGILSGNVAPNGKKSFWRYVSRENSCFGPKIPKIPLRFSWKVENAKPTRQ